jgi:chitinase
MKIKALYITLLACTLAMPTLTMAANKATNPVFSEYWCGPDAGCSGQSQNFSDINSKTNFVFVAFALVDNNGVPTFQLNSTISTDQFKADIKQLQSANVPKKVILSVGGQGADWAGALNNPSAFASGIAAIINQYGFDGVDLDIESASLATAQQAQQLIQVIQDLRQQFNTITNKHLFITVSPESTTVVNTVPAIGGGWNAMVPVINNEINDIDFIQVQEYNDNPYGDQPGSVQFLEDIYNNWVAPFPATNPVKYNGMPASKLLMGIPASTDAATSSYYPAPDVLTQVLKDLASKYTQGQNTFGGVMTWDSHWDALNNYTVSNLVTNYSFSK